MVMDNAGGRRHAGDAGFPGPVTDGGQFPIPAVPDERSQITGEDPARENLVNDLMDEPARPLTDDEKEAAERDPGRSERVYAPASARVPNEPAPGDDKLIHKA